MQAHVIDLQFWATENQRFVDRKHPSTPFIRWSCSCGRIGPAILTRPMNDYRDSATRTARNGGARHVAAMERAR